MGPDIDFTPFGRDLRDPNDEWGKPTVLNP
jgi:hypothetical protein